MESNKENVENIKSSTRIPLPLDPLPALPKHLLKENRNTSEISRQPLRMISNDNVAGPSQNEVSSRRKNRTVLIDARYVTLRPKKEGLGPQYKYVNDNPTTSNHCVDSSINRDALNAKALCYFKENTQNNYFGDGSTVVTPAVKSPILEPSRVKNIKQSLKRPHSRELQGISPLAGPENVGNIKVKRRLLFSDSLQEKLLSPDFLKKTYIKCLTRDYTMDVFSYLLEVEKKPLDVPKTPSMTRACVINWIMKVNGVDGNPAVVQSACWYLDSVLGTLHVELEKLQLLSAACYWIAQKLIGPVYSAKRLVKFANMAFSAQRLLAAEKLVLRKLKFPSQPVVAQDFITYLAWWCDSEYPGEIEIAATFLCMAGLMVDKCLCMEYPSVLAAASVYNALLLLRKQNLMKRLHTAPVYKLAQKKAINIENTNSSLLKAVRMVASPYYEYKTPFEHYGIAPIYIAQRIVHAANDLVFPPP